jgi:hypothetical protein
MAAGPTARSIGTIGPSSSSRPSEIVAVRVAVTRLQAATPEPGRSDRQRVERRHFRAALRACLLAKQQNASTSDRVFDFCVTHDSDTVIAAALSVLARVLAHGGS